MGGTEVESPSPEVSTFNMSKGLRKSEPSNLSCLPQKNFGPWGTTPLDIHRLGRLSPQQDW